MKFGIDQLIAKKRDYKGLRLGLVTNDAALTTRLEPSRCALQAAGFHLQCLFSPEHGLTAMGTDGAAMPNVRDAQTGLPVISLYTTQQRVSVEQVAELDAILFDLPDIGSRFYTYIWTLSHLMETCAETATTLIVLDRPNPISGLLPLSEGPMLDEANLSSFIGRWNIPVRHSLTIGELANYWKSNYCKTLDLQIIPMKGWRRQWYFKDLGLPFVPTSPAINSVETALTYPALCFLEGTNLSEGRGTAYPFRVCGSPWLDGHAIAKAFNDCGFEGVIARALSFSPLEGKFSGQLCSGIMLHVVDDKKFRPVRTGLGLVALLRLCYPEQFAWADYPTAANPKGARHFDLLCGQYAVREMIVRDADAFLARPEQFTGTDNWGERVKPYLLYH